VIFELAWKAWLVKRILPKPPSLDTFLLDIISCILPVGTKRGAFFFFFPSHTAIQVSVHSATPELAFLGFAMRQ
jgi:hypothetical protein